LRLALLNHGQHLLATVQLVHAKPTPKERDGVSGRPVTVKDIPADSEFELLQTLGLPTSLATTYQSSAHLEIT